MTARKHLNGVLSRLTGYELRRASHGAKPGAKTAGKIPADIDEEASAIIRSVAPYTMTHVEKLSTATLTAHGMASATVAP